MKSTPTLKRKQHELAKAEAQLALLNSTPLDFVPAFESRLSEFGFHPLKPASLDILQVNLGKMCNQTCKHCHVDAGPDRKEIMTRDTMHQCLEVLRSGCFETLDLTGGAPELNPDFRWFVEQSRKFVDTLIVRSNLTIITANDRFYDLPQFFKQHRVDVVSSLPFYSRSRTDAQRGEGVFQASITALQLLNELGFGLPDSDLILNLVYNPTGSFLPADQAGLEQEYKSRLKREFNVDFHELYTITNMPVSRFLDYLVQSGNLNDYMEKLLEAFNPTAVPGVMCRNTLSVGWDGQLYDCDFNQMLELKSKGIQHIASFDAEALTDRSIRVNKHCYGCTAGAGSSCGGSLT